MVWIICKLPHGLTIRHNGQAINLNGANEGYDPADLAPNGGNRDGENRAYGFGLTELKGDEETAFQDWANAVTYKEGDKAKGKHAEPFAALENGAIVTFKTKDEARKEAKNLSGLIETGTEGIDPSTDKEMKAAGIQTATK